MPNRAVDIEEDIAEDMDETWRSEAQAESLEDQWMRYPHGIPIFYDKQADGYGEGLVYFQKWWFLNNDVDISVGGVLLHGTPIFLRENTLRMVSGAHSYFIPLRHVEYIRTSHGMSNF